MEEIKTIGIVTGSEDYKESDKLVRLLTPEKGLIRVLMRGVKKSNAKLKYAAMPFAFCEYEIMRRGDYYTVKTAVPLESLYGVTSTPEKYVCASIILESASEVARESQVDMFVELLDALKTIIYGQTNEYLTALKFLNLLLKSEGHVAETEREKRFFENIDSPDEYTLSRANVFLKRYAAVFEKKIICKLKSAELL